ncbi:DNA double-strand break repair nuclease NurA [Romeria aff. gracilis LEGE 07310]|uniref:DNA double-strand break repair nuclease NurA n=2 Tax=Vasconcelosia TaxID=3366328 RepID=A0A8J7DAN0_9CYAN|nr:DNA double-strand break repair nuclease NurA [Romeria aff. gracilis LEGE 07310]
MAIKPSQIQAILNHKRTDFATFNQGAASSLQAYQAAWEGLSQTSEAELASWLKDQSGEVGARPLESFRDTRDGIIRSGLSWPNREQSLAWVKAQLDQVTTFAVDGSQIFPSKDLSIPIALVQIGWFENPHAAQRDYVKDISLDVLTPKELSQTSQPAERWVNLRRFEMEVQRLVDYMQQVTEPERCLVFFDGSLVLSFADMMEDEIGQPYVQSVTQLLQASERYRVPLVGYVDTAGSRDLVTLLKTFADLEAAVPIHDAQLLNPLMTWGDRTPLCQCDRGGILNRYGNLRDRVTFTYLKTNQSYPARIELPRWLWEEGRVKTVLDWVRAEVIVGGGYPYAIETADQTAVLQSRDRQLFYRILQDWADGEDLPLRLSRKMLSKAQRR